MDKDSQRIFEALYDLHDRYDEDPKHMICADGAEQIKKLSEKIDTLKQQVPHWISVKDRLPSPEEEVIVLCVALCGYKQITTALYEDGTVNADESDWNWTDVNFDYDEKSGIYYIPKGWWEYKHYNPDDVYNNAVDDKVLYWMPLPEPPKEENK